MKPDDIKAVEEALDTAYGAGHLGDGADAFRRIVDELQRLRARVASLDVRLVEVRMGDDL